ncbi:pentapeptide repeat-containing protein [Cardiobacterium hominis]|uniref:Pentapeptide repeat protein n=1 Tax=Cardiobacterium hominis (strain ATCC 15826 / DSM 8339 / NCTC 10426 / 6573) TaxID=638300 RepID=C8NAQ5_CARH6|nr:pentapeptide repeat-containing protein [Cardiobacterium hominis]EEV88276.1 pentapeptide repeat protein [Cardiobacterium hominis ATCC 15826]VEG78085.1 Pentapeptide repeats (8 copies) [Cardiobacterium hominis]
MKEKKRIVSLLSIFIILLFCLIFKYNLIFDECNRIWNWILLPIILLVTLIIFNSHNKIRPVIILLTSGLTILTLYLIVKYGFPQFIETNVEKIIGANGIWTFMALIVSAPTAFAIWHFRDSNNIQQIENDRKDVNLKEFQKIVEWVGNIDSNTDTSSPLIVSSVYNLLPFLRGDRGEDFISPALNLLISAWYKLQEKNIRAVRNLKFDSHYFPLKTDHGNSLEELYDLLNNIKSTRDTFLAKAITKVLLSDGGDNLKRDPKIFNSLCLIGMDFNLYGLEHNKLKNLFVNIEGNLDNLELQGCNLDKFNFRGSELRRVYLLGASLREAIFQDCSIFLDNLIGADISGSNLIDTTFDQVILGKPCTLDPPNDRWQVICYGAFMLHENYNEDKFSLDMEDMKGSGIIFLNAKRQWIPKKHKIYIARNVGSIERYSNTLQRYTVNNKLTNENNACWEVNPNWWTPYDD